VHRIPPIRSIFATRSMKDRPTVLLLIPHLGGGGSEKVAENLVRNLSQEKYELHLCLVTDSNNNKEPLPGGVTVHHIGARRVRFGLYPVLKLIRRLKPAVVLSGMIHLNLLVLALRPFFPRLTRILVRQNSNATLADGSIRSWASPIYRALYRRSDRVICQSQSMARDFCSTLRFPSEKTAILANPVDVEGIRALPKDTLPQWPGSGPHLLAVGRLSHEKGFDLLLEAFVSVREHFPTASLAIAGTGPEVFALKALSKSYALDGSVRFLGQVASPARYFRGATLFVLPSRHDTMPNALLEAAAAELPLVTLPASTGLVDLLSAETGAWIAPEVSAESLASTLIGVLHRLKPKERFKHPWIEQFRMDRAVAAYESLIDETIEARHS
jgi:glycosyltransferase involved in cell wall biosynthesis